MPNTKTQFRSLTSYILVSFSRSSACTVGTQAYVADLCTHKCRASGKCATVCCVQTPAIVPAIHSAPLALHATSCTLLQHARLRCVSPRGCRPAAAAASAHHPRRPTLLTLARPGCSTSSTCSAGGGAHQAGAPHAGPGPCGEQPPAAARQRRSGTPLTNCLRPSSRLLINLRVRMVAMVGPRALGRARALQATTSERGRGGAAVRLGRAPLATQGPARRQPAAAPVTPLRSPWDDDSPVAAAPRRRAATAPRRCRRQLDELPVP